MTSNVVALPGIGIGPHTPARPVANSHAAITNVRDERQPYNPNKRDAHDHGGGVAKGASSRPQSPVALNTLLAAQEQGGEAATEGQASTAKNDALQATQLSEGEQKQVRELKAADAEIRRHEQAHAAAGGQYAGAPQYEYTDGPDGKRYATSGHVSIDVTPIAGDPKATIEKMDVVQRAANAPAEPSGADRSVAAKAAALKQTAQVELAQAKQAEAEERTNPDGAEGTEGVNESSNADVGFVEGFAFPDAAKPDGSGKGDGQSADKSSLPSVGVSPAAAAAAYAATPLNSVAGS